MKIKRYTAQSMRAALALVRAEQGTDAVILSSRRGDDGIEVIAAVDYDEALFVDANRQRQAPIGAAPQPISQVPQPMKAAPAEQAAPSVNVAPARVGAAAPRAVPQPVAAPSSVVSRDLGYHDMHRYL